MNFTRSIVIVAVAVVGVWLLTSSIPLAPPHVFSVEDLKGRYTFVTEADVLEGPLVGQAVAVGYFDFDGQGVITFATQSLNLAGEVFNENQEASGTYTVNADGTGKMLIVPDSDPSAEFSFDVVLVNRREILGVATTPGLVGGTVFKRQRR